MSTVDEILGEFIDAWKAGERPDLDAYLERVPAGDRDELAAGIAAWLDVAPTPDYPRRCAGGHLRRAGDAGGAAGRRGAAPTAAGEPPVLRERAGLGIRDVAARLAERFGLADRDRTVAYLEPRARGTS